MGVGFVFYFLVLLWLTQTVGSRGHEAGSVCTEICGNVSITYPFGIEEGCYPNSWFQVSCNKTDDGRSKPFLKRLNDLELLYSYSEGVVLVNNPVIYFNCNNSKDSNNVVGAFTKILPDDSPFSFSTSSNSIGSVGCGNMAIVHINQIPTGGCLQPGCVNNGQFCYIRHITENLSALAANMTDIFPSSKGSNRCSSAFIFDYNSMMDPDGAIFPNFIGIESTHVPATLEWTALENITCDLEECPEPGGRDDHRKCTRRCGDAYIEWPFGIETGCYMNEWFMVSCKADEKAFLEKINMEMINSSLILSGEVIVNTPIYSSCRGEGNGSSVNLKNSPFFFSTSNIFQSIGCGSLITIFQNQTDPIGGCLQSSYGDGISSFRNGCDIPVPQGLSSFAAKITEFHPSNSCSNISCSYAYMYHKLAWRSARISRHNVTSVTHVPSALQFAMPKFGICDLHEGSGFSCSSDGTYCWANLSSSHLCVCTYEQYIDSPHPFYYVNKYLIDVCREAGYCEDHRYKFCYMLCLNEPGNNNCYSTSCPTGYVYDRTRSGCRPIHIASKGSAIFIGCSTSFGTLLLLLAAWCMYKVLKRRNKIRRKQKFFKQNGGLLLQKQLSCNEGKIETIRFFTSKELEKATDHYNENRIVGAGAQGTVYKGMLADGRIVAIKKPKVERSEKKKQFLDEKQLELWVNEVMILSQINHRNVVKLFGCCLETQFPLLVYEFIPNGTLSQMLNDHSEEFPLTWEMRLRIANEAANAVSYLHSAASVPIYHRDIKSTNILLDDKYRAKVSDFGISKSIGLEQTHLTTQVQGTFGYLDPEYFRSYQFTEKSDVYSFGVVLAELLTGQKPFASSQPGHDVKSLVPTFLLSMKENTIVDILDPRLRNNSPPEGIIAAARLAKRCLNLDGKRRPTMKQVAMELESIRAAPEANSVEQISDADEDFEYDRTEPWAKASCSTTSVFLSKNSVTAPLLDSDAC